MFGYFYYGRTARGRVRVVYRAGHTTFLFPSGVHYVYHSVFLRFAGMVFRQVPTWVGPGRFFFGTGRRFLQRLLRVQVVSFMILFVFLPSGVGRTRLSFRPNLFPSRSVVCRKHVSGKRLVPIAIGPIANAYLSRVLSHAFISIPLRHAFGRVLRNTM